MVDETEARRRGSLARIAEIESIEATTVEAKAEPEATDLQPGVSK